MQAITVGSGAALGAVARLLLFGLLGGSAVPLLLINIFGSALMGYLRPGPFWGTGVLGGFTSFATFTALSLAMPATGAAAYVALTLLGCVGAWWVGDAARRKLEAQS